MKDKTIVIGESNMKALEALFGMFANHCWVIPATMDYEVTQYYVKFEPDLVILDEDIYGKLGAKELLSILISEYGAKVIILTDSLDPQHYAMWLKRGAYACIPHPTKNENRRLLLIKKVEESTVINGNGKDKEKTDLFALNR
jgi:DNA-binding NtrC family response regulator